MINYKLLVLDPYGQHYLCAEDCYFKEAQRLRGTVKDVFYSGKTMYKKASILHLTGAKKVDFGLRLKKFLRLVPALTKRWH